MLLSPYQQSEIVIGTIIFAILYVIFRTFFVKSTYMYFDILYSTFAIFVILFLKHFIANYYQIQTQTI